VKRSRLLVVGLHPHRIGESAAQEPADQQSYQTKTDESYAKKIDKEVALGFDSHFSKGRLNMSAAPR
jgi:hypothetical protein